MKDKAKMLNSKQNFYAMHTDFNKKHTLKHLISWRNNK